MIFKNYNKYPVNFNKIQIYVVLQSMSDSFKKIRHKDKSKL